MENQIGIPATDNPEQGVVLTDFEITPKIIEDARSYVVNSLETFQSQRADIEVKWRKYDYAYRSKLEPPASPHSKQTETSWGRHYAGYNDKASPLIHDNVEAIKARLKESIIPINKKWVDIDSQFMSPDIKEIRNDQLNNQLSKNDIEEKMDIVAHNAALFGTFFISVPFINEENKILTRQLVTKEVPILDPAGNPVLDADGAPILQQVQSLEVVPEIDRQYFGPGYEPVKDNEDVFLDMFIEDIQDQPIVIRRYSVDWDHLVQGVEKGIYFADQVLKVKDKAAKASSPFGDNSTRSEEALGVSDTGSFTSSKKSPGKPDLYDMYQAYCNFQVEVMREDGSKEKITKKCVISVIANEVIQLMENPFFHQMIPLIKGTYRNIPGEAYGIGAIEPVIGMYQEYNDTMNQINDSKILSLNPIKITTARSVADKQDLDIFPGAEWFEKQPGDIRFAQFDFSVVANGLQYLELLELKINKGMGVQRLMQGAGDQSDLDQTATGVGKVIEQADKKFRMIAKRIENSAIKNWAELAYKINMQFLPISIDNNFGNINQEITFNVKGVDNFFDNMDETNKLISFTQQSGQIPGINVVGLVMTIADKMDIEIDERYGPLFTPVAPQKDTKPMSLSTNISLDPSKGTWMALAAAQLLAKKEGIFLDLDAIGKAAEVVTHTADPKALEESGILPAEKKESTHTIRKRDGGEISKTISS